MQQMTQASRALGMAALLLIFTAVSLAAFVAPTRCAPNTPDKAALFTAQKTLLRAMIAERTPAHDAKSASKNLLEAELICRAQARLGDIAGAFDTVAQTPPPQRGQFYIDIAAAPAERVDAAGRRLMDQLPVADLQHFVAAEQAAVGHTDRAIATVNQISDPELRFSLLCDLASNRIDKRDKIQARHFLDVAAGILGGLPQLNVPESIVQLVELRTLAGDLPAALAMAERAPEQDVNLGLHSSSMLPLTDRQDMLFYIARRQADAGDLDGAKLTAKQITDRNCTALADQYIAITDVIVHARAGDFVTAKKLAGKLTDSDGDAPGIGSSRSIAEVNIADSQAGLGDWSAVQDTLSDLPESLDTADVYLGVALAFAKAGYADEMNEAIAVAASIKGKPRIYQYESYRLDLLAAALAVSGDAQSAITAIQQSENDPYKRCYALWEAILNFEGD